MHFLKIVTFSVKLKEIKNIFKCIVKMPPHMVIAIISLVQLDAEFLF